MSLSLDIRRMVLEVKQETFLRVPLLRELCSVTFLVFAGVLFFFPGLGDLEFFRHTEADRSLIAWEMLQRGDYLVPHLLGSEILTKPPLFYWLQSGSFAFFGEVSEFAARVPSALFGIAGMLLQFAVLRALGVGRIWSLAAACILGSSVQYFLLARRAEIDMSYGFFSFASFYALFFWFRSFSWVCLFAAYFSLAAAFLVKGPPTVVFFGLTLLVMLYVERDRSSGRWRSVFVQHSLGAFLFLMPVAYWLYLLGQRVGFDPLVLEFQSEILHRAVMPSLRERGPFFYFTTVVGVLIPWSFLLLVFCPVVLFNIEQCKNCWRLLSPQVRHLLVFSAIAFISAFLTLSLAKGKSSRYLFPAHVCLVNLLFGSLLCLAHSEYLQLRVLRVSKWVSIALLLVACPVVAWFLYWGPPSGVSGLSLGLTIFSLALALVLFNYFCGSKAPRGALIVFLSTFLIARLGYQYLYVPHRHSERSVRAAAREIQQVVSPGAQIFTLEMYERWLLFYLKLKGLESYRVTPSFAKSMTDQDKRLFLLLNEKDELWRMTGIRQHDSKMKLVKRIPSGNDVFLLLDVSAAALSFLELQERFPTSPTEPQFIEKGG